ncbi:MAG: winged helix DNA-binding domain-containing protein [Chloroflexi bacterium]|nr:winged helix DNA-binding domain-containing protein [Chloroflexota bacterium]
MARVTGGEDELSLRQLNRATLERQGLLDRHEGSVADVVGRLAGLQAQHPNAPYVALWSRLRGLRMADLEGALEARSVVKATIMRTTLHLVDARDYAAFNAASSEARRANWAPTVRRAGIDLGAMHGALLAFCQVPRTVAEMEAHLDAIVSDDQLAGSVPGGVRHAAFRIASASGGLVHVPPSGFWRTHDKPRYIDARVWLPGVAATSPDRALETAMTRYLAAYGPASLEDVGKWVGQPRASRLRTAAAALAGGLRRYVGADGRNLLDLADRPLPDGDRVAPVRFLSRWDSVIIGYDVRDRILPEAYRAPVIKKNGDFLPTFLIDGWIAGLWTTDRVKHEATIRLTPFAAVPSTVRKALETEAAGLIRFVEPDADRHGVRWEAALG